MIWNARVDAGVTTFFMLAVLVIVADSVREWSLVLSRRKAAVSTEVPFERREAA
jgi:carbon starvation protein